MATTSFVGVMESEKGLDDREIVTGGDTLESGLILWMWRVESQEPEMTRPCSLLYTTDLTPAL